MKSLYLAICLLSAPLLLAQPLEELLELLPFQNLGQIAQRSDHRAALQQAEQAGQLENPVFGIGIFTSPVETRLGGQQTRFSAEQQLPWPGTLVVERRLASAMAKAAGAVEEIHLIEARYQLKTAYLRLYENYRRSDIIQRKIQVLERLESFAIAQVAGGSGTATDVIRAQIKREELEQELRLLTSASIDPTVTINNLLNRPPATEVITVDTLAFATLNFELAEEFASLPQQHPVLKRNTLEREVAETSIALNSLSAKPSLGLGVDYILVSERTDFNPRNNGRDVFQIRVNFSLPLYQRKFRAKDREERLRIESLDLRTEELTDAFAGAITQAYARHDRARIRRELYARQMLLTRSALDLVTEEYGESGENFAEVLRLQEELIEYELKQLTAVVESHLAKAEVERYLLE